MYSTTYFVIMNFLSFGIILNIFLFLPLTKILTKYFLKSRLWAILSHINIFSESITIRGRGNLNEHEYLVWCRLKLPHIPQIQGKNWNIIPWLMSRPILKINEIKVLKHFSDCISVVLGFMHSVTKKYCQLLLGF